MTELALISPDELSISGPALDKLTEIMGQLDEEVAGIRVSATPGGCSGVSVGMSFTEEVNDDDARIQCGSFDVIVDQDSIEFLRGSEIDFVDRGNGNASFVFNNLQPAGGGCSSCGSGCG